ncbi:MAG: sulfite exporter TauE/SafE family protein [Nitrospirota bacterium]
MNLEIFLIGIVVFFASILQGMFGFAFMLVALPFLSYFMSIKVAVPLLSLLFVLTSAIMTFQLRGKFAYRNVMPLLIGALFGIPVGIHFILEFSERLIKTVLGILFIVYSVYSLFIRIVPFRLPAWTGYIFGFFSGALGGAFNLTGPPIVLYISAQQWSKTNTLGSLIFFFFVTSVLVVIFHFVVGNITYYLSFTFLKLVPFVIAGMLLGSHFFRKINNENYRKGLFVFLIIMGAMLLIR